MMEWGDEPNGSSRFFHGSPADGGRHGKQFCGKGFASRLEVDATLGLLARTAKKRYISSRNSPNVARYGRGRQAPAERCIPVSRQGIRADPTGDFAQISPVLFRKACEFVPKVPKLDEQEQEYDF